VDGARVTKGIPQVISVERSSTNAGREQCLHVIVSKLWPGENAEQQKKPRLAEAITKDVNGNSALWEEVGVR